MKMVIIISYLGMTPGGYDGEKADRFVNIYRKREFKNEKDNLFDLDPCAVVCVLA